MEFYQKGRKSIGQIQKKQEEKLNVPKFTDDMHLRNNSISSGKTLEKFVKNKEAEKVDAYVRNIMGSEFADNVRGMEELGKNYANLSDSVYNIVTYLDGVIEQLPEELPSKMAAQGEDYASLVRKLKQFRSSVAELDGKAASEETMEALGLEYVNISNQIGDITDPYADQVGKKRSTTGKIVEILNGINPVNVSR